MESEDLLGICNLKNARGAQNEASNINFYFEQNDPFRKTGNYYPTEESYGSILIPHTSIIDDRCYAPPPPLPTQNSLVRFEFMAERPADHDNLPSFQKVIKAGTLLSRISIKSLVTKQWRDNTFWIIYGSSCVHIFRSIRDYEEWLLNPYLSKNERTDLIKLTIDFENDLSVTGIRGYKTTAVRKKIYRSNGALYQFKIDQMTLYGPSLVAAFASSNKEDIVKFHSLFNELMKKSTLNTSLLKLSTRTKSTRTTILDSTSSLSVPNFAVISGDTTERRTSSRSRTTYRESRN